MTSVFVSARVKLKRRIKEAARARILAMVPEWKQQNMTARGVELVQKQVAGVALTADELAEKATLEAAWNQIKAIRSYSDQLELDVDNGLPIDLDSGWPF